MQVRSSFLAATLILSASSIALAQQSGAPQLPTRPGQTLTIDMRDAKNNLVGTVQVRPTAHGTLFTANLMNLPPGGHGFHIHERGVCDAPDFKSAGGHFNPNQGEHGFNNRGKYHAGDLPNVYVTAQGAATAEFHTDRLTLSPAQAVAQTGAGQQTAGQGGAGAQAAMGEPYSLLGPNGTAIVIHANPDDYSDVNSAGPRIACGVIKPPS